MILPAKIKQNLEISSSKVEVHHISNLSEIIEAIKVFLQENNVDVLRVSETGINSANQINMCKFQGYKICNMVARVF